MGMHPMQSAPPMGGGAQPIQTMAPQTQKPRIDPNQIPSPITEQEKDQIIWEQSAYGTCSAAPVPLSTSDVVCVDEGNFYRIGKI